MDIKAIEKSSQEQAVGAWIDYLNNERISRCFKELNLEQTNFENAISYLHDALEIVEKDIVNNGKGRGGTKGMHGFIAEVAECGIGNARSAMLGESPSYIWIDNNGRDDFLKNGIAFQQKFSEAGGRLSLKAIEQHLHNYPDFIKQGGKYQIPKDHYDKIMWYLSIPKADAQKMPTATGDFSLKQWREVHDFFENGIVPLDKIEPSLLTYDSVQQGTYHETFAKEEETLINEHYVKKDEVLKTGKPTKTELGSVAIHSASFEGLASLCFAIAERCKEKGIVDFTSEDWNKVFSTAGTSAVEGGVRGIGVYYLTNFSATPAAVASSMVSTSINIAEQAHRYRNGTITEKVFLESSLIMCLESTISSLSTMVGQMAFPIPILGALIGNTAGMLLYQIAEDHLNQNEQKVILQLLISLKEKENRLNEEYWHFVEQLSEEILQFIDLLDKAFSPDISEALYWSAQLARDYGVDESLIIDNKEKLFDFFLL